MTAHRTTSARPIRAWWLNLDADDELSGLNVPKSTERVIESRRKELATSLLIHDDVLLAEELPMEPSQLVGWSWCATAKARRALKTMGIAMAQVPPLSVIQTVTRRDFSERLSETSLRTTFVRDERALRELISQFTANREQCRLSRMHTASGRGHQVIDHWEACERWCRHVLASDGCVEIAPQVKVLQEFALHGWIARDGRCTLGEPTTQHTLHSQWVSTVRAPSDELTSHERTQLTLAAQQAATALWDSGYFGAFGIDAFRYVNSQQKIEFCARRELNARFTMGWSVGMGDRRPDYELRS